MPCAAHGVDDIGETIGEAAEPGDEKRSRLSMSASRSRPVITARRRDRHEASGCREIPAARGRRARAARPRRRSPKRATARRSRNSIRLRPAARAAASASAWAGCDRTRWSIAGARRGLAAFVQPKSGDHARIIRAPDARHEARLRRRRHDAGRGAHDVGEAIETLRLPALGAAAADARRCPPHARRSARRRPAFPDDRPSSPRGCLRQPRAERRCRARRSRFRSSHSSRQELAKPDALKIAARSSASHARG